MKVDNIIISNMKIDELFITRDETYEHNYHLAILAPNNKVIYKNYTDVKNIKHALIVEDSNIILFLNQIDWLSDNTKIKIIKSDILYKLPFKDTEKTIEFLKCKNLSDFICAFEDGNSFFMYNNMEEFKKEYDNVDDVIWHEFTDGSVLCIVW